MLIVDTDVMIDILRGYKPALEWLKSLKDEEILIPGFVVMELIQGCRNKKEQNRIEKEILKYEILWPTPEICEEALKTFSKFHLSKGIGIIDSLIAQLSVSLRIPLCTFNHKHYNFVPGIKLIKPYKRIT